MTTDPSDKPRDEQKKDAMLGLCKQQGYVPADCYLTGIIVFGLVNSGKDPCKGCNLDRKICKGRPK